VAFVLSPEDLKDLLVSSRLRDRAHAEFEAFFALVDSRILPAAAELTDRDVEQLVDRVR
jgi:hypothetical protein